MDLFSRKEGYSVNLTFTITGSAPLQEVFAHAYDPEYPEEGILLALLGNEALLGRTGYQSITEWNDDEPEVEIDMILERTPTQWLEEIAERLPDNVDIEYEWLEFPDGACGGWRRVKGQYLPL